MSEPVIARVLYRTESLPPIHSVWLTDPPLYVAGVLTAEARTRYVEGHGWEVIEPTASPAPNSLRNPAPIQSDQQSS